MPWDQLVSGALGAIVASIISSLIALNVARKSSDDAEIRLRAELQQAEVRLRQEFAMESSLEAAVRSLMTKGFALRSFSLIRHHLRGFDDDELRKTLIRSGCICFKVIRGMEYWGILSENEALLKDRKSMERNGVRFFDLDDTDEDADTDEDGVPEH